MDKYLIEGDFNFYEELKKQIQDSDTDNEDDNIKRCFITNKPLTEPYITLPCNHTFNYEPLYKDIVNAKLTNHMEYAKLCVNQIRCPYCRLVIDHVLPYSHEYKKCKDGVNWFDVGKYRIRDSIKFTTGKCMYDVDGKQRCCVQKVIKAPINDMEYCMEHYGMVYSRKQMRKKTCLKIPKNNKSTKNVIINSSKPILTEENTIISSGLCPAILKSGARKGCSCNAKVKISGWCMRHAPKT